ncbi:hypothetical protein HAX54_024291 [Datura stramonium]|uniref:VQ domain-containing protein n=1 Tax=Datura stramonium TaxID=4076 RepID=A0ABS8UXT7_DATST|nr:hypothetical protein [Datura stramonium]
MEWYSSYKVYSSSFSSSSSSFAGHDHQHDEKKEKSYLSTLHTVRSLPSKPTITKKPMALSPTIIPPKIYRVEAVNFRQVVQMLTAAPEFQFQSPSNSMPASASTHLPEVAPPPPLDLSSPTSLSSNMSPIGGQWREFLPPASTVVMSTDEASNDSTTEAQERHVKSPIPPGACSPLAFPQSPSSFAWCSSLLSTPDTLTSLDSSAVL